MFQRGNARCCLLHLLLAAVAIPTVLLRFSNAGGQPADDWIYTWKLSNTDAQPIEVDGRAANSGTNNERQDSFDPGEHAPLLDSSKTLGVFNKHKNKRSTEMKESAGSCEIGWTFKGNACYRLTSQELTWSQAQAECRSMRSLLAEIENAREQDSVHNFLTSQGSEWAWIGLSKQTSDGSWVWSSGRPMTYSNWLRTKRENEPNNHGGSENCVNVWPKRNSTWNDYMCTINMTGVCQKATSGKSADTTSIRPSFVISTRATTPRSGAAVTTTKATGGCDVESPLCRTLSERGFCSQGIHRHYMAIACRRSCDRCP